jgi:hypothetical protein
MTISRRLALGYASAFALAGGMTRFGAVRAATGGHSHGIASAQRFNELLIHRDEAGHTAHYAMIWMPAPNTAWYAVDTLDALKYRTLNTHNKKQGYRLKRVNAFKTKDGVCYAACWERASGPEWHSRHGLSLSEFKQAASDFAHKGWRMSHVDARVGYAAIWEHGDASSQQTFIDLSRSDYEQLLASTSAQGYRPTRVSISTGDGAPRFTGILEKDTSIWQSHHQLTAAQFKGLDAQMRSQGYRLMDASGYMLGAKPNFAGVWVQA